jgi:hypothetical protein
MMQYYIGIDTADLNDPHGKGALIAYTKIDDKFVIVKTYESMSPQAFNEEVEKMKEFYKDCKILEWS